MERIVSLTSQLLRTNAPSRESSLTPEAPSSSVVRITSGVRSASRPAMRDYGPGRILVVDNDLATLEVFQKIFSRETETASPQKADSAAHPQPAFRVDLLQDGEAACKRALNALRRGRPYAIAFVNMNMSKSWDGLETAAALWRIDPNIQVVICAAPGEYSWDDISARLGQSNQALLLRKPFEKIEALQLACTLTEKWRLVMERHAHQDELERQVAERTEYLEVALREREAYEMELHHQATHDVLTGLPNRVLLHERISQSINQARQTRQGMAVLFVDLNRFKSINDSHGHSIGDALLTAVAGRLKTAVRESDIVARLSGDEFVVVLSGVSHKEDIEQVAQKLLAELSRAFEIERQLLTITASIGVSIYPKDGDTSDMLLRNADAAMYCAKDQGNGVKFYSRDLSSQVNEHVALENALRQAVDYQEFELHYQPKVDLKTGRISGVEALIRWRHAERGLIPPDKFIPLAEETGLIVSIGEWALRTACAQIKAWHDAGYPDLSMAVNFSPRQFQQQDIPDLVRCVLAETGLDAKYLEVELTESLLMQDSEFTVQALRQLRDMGVVLALDDFGTGYSSLSYLQRFPINVVKVDRSFIRDVINRPDDASLTKAIIAMAKSLNLKTVAEGVETEGQLAFLKTNQCDAIQGYYFSRPLPADDVTTMLRNGKHITI